MFSLKGRFFAKLLVVFAALSLCHSANAAETSIWAGGAFGVLVPNKSGSTARPQYGITAGAKLGSEFGLGAYYLTSKKDEAAPLGTFDLDFYGVEGSFHFEGEAKGAYFAARLGITKIDAETGATKVSVSPFHVGLAGGYNYAIAENVSVGGDIAFYSVSKGEATSLTGAVVSVDSFSALGFLASAKFWF